MTKDGRGRGLYATRKIRTGERVLVSNAVAVAYESASTTVLYDLNKELYAASQEDLVPAVICEATKSQRLLRQIYSLHDSSTPGSVDVPAIDLFKMESRMSKDQGDQDQNLKVDVSINVRFV